MMCTHQSGPLCSPIVFVFVLCVSFYHQHFHGRPVRAHKHTHTHKQSDHHKQVVHVSTVCTRILQHLLGKLLPAAQATACWCSSVHLRPLSEWRLLRGCANSSCSNQIAVGSKCRALGGPFCGACCECPNHSRRSKGTGARRGHDSVAQAERKLLYCLGSRGFQEIFCLLCQLESDWWTGRNLDSARRLRFWLLTALPQADAIIENEDGPEEWPDELAILGSATC